MQKPFSTRAWRDINVKRSFNVYFVTIFGEIFEIKINCERRREAENGI